MKKNQIFTLFYISLLITLGCGKETPNSRTSDSPNLGEDSSSRVSKHDKVKDDCIVAGNIRAFEINCTKAIHMLTLPIKGGFRMGGGGFTFNTNERGLNFFEFEDTYSLSLSSVHPRNFPNSNRSLNEGFKLDLKGTQTSIVGSESLASTLDFTINFKDSSTFDVKLRN